MAAGKRLEVWIQIHGKRPVAVHFMADIRPELDSDKVEQLHQTIAHHTQRGGTPPAKQLTQPQSAPEPSMEVFMSQSPDIIIIGTGVHSAQQQRLSWQRQAIKHSPDRNTQIGHGSAVGSCDSSGCITQH